MLIKNFWIFVCVMVVICLTLPVAQAATKVSKYAYVAQNDEIVTYTINPDGGLRIVQAIASGQATPAQTAGTPFVSPSNKFVYNLTGVNGSQSIWGYKIGSNGTLTQIAGSPFASTGATSLAFIPNGKFAYAVDWTPNSETYSEYVEEFSVNTSTGALTSIGTVFSGQDTVDVVVNAKGTFAYVVNIMSQSISTFSINPTTGLLTAITGSPVSVPGAPVVDLLSANGKYLFSVNFASSHQTGSISVFTVNAKTGALTLLSNNLFPSGWGYSGGNATLDPSGKFLYVGSAISGEDGLDAFSVDEANGTVAPIGLYSAGTGTYGVTTDASTGFLYVSNDSGIADEPPLFVFSITPGTGVLTEVATYGVDGQFGGLSVALASGTARAVYSPSFAYATDSGSKSVSELSIAGGGLTVTGTLTDTNGPQASTATPGGEFFYTGNSNGSISEYKVGKTGTLAKIKGSPIKGLTNPVSLVFSPFYDWLYALDPTAGFIDVYTSNPTTGVLTYSTSTSDTNNPQAAAVDPFGAFALAVETATDDVLITIPYVGLVGTVPTGLSPVAITIDPTSQFVYVANSGDGTVSAYNLSLDSPYLTQIGAAVPAGTTPLAVLAEPYGHYLYVANSGDSTISAYSINAFSGALTPVSGSPFSTVSGPSALSVSNDGKYLYVTGPTADELQQFTINSDGTLSNAGGTGLGAATGATSITTVGTYK
jgi:6-phosphogluconolactonase (cycloisomerase 2 family)